MDVWLLDLVRGWETKHQEAASQSPGQTPGSSRPGPLPYLGPRASYVFPSIGGWCNHVSGCDPKSVGGDGTRIMDWKLYSVQEGVRPEDGKSRFVTAKDWAENRELLKFVPKRCGGQKRPVEGGALRFPDVRARLHDLTWFTERAPTTWDSADGTLRKILRRRGWVDDRGAWTGPLGERGLWWWQNWRYSESARAGRPQHPVLPERIQTDPNEVCPDLDDPSDLANFMKLIVLDWMDANPEHRWDEMHRRERTARTKALAFYRGRSFARPGKQVRGPENNHRPPRQLCLRFFRSSA